MMNDIQTKRQATAKVIPISIASGWKNGYQSYDHLIVDTRVPGWLVLLMEWLKQLKNFLVNNSQKFVFFFCILSLVSCKKESLDNVEDIPGLGGDTWEVRPSTSGCMIV
jgi:hypothetical protein